MQESNIYKSTDRKRKTKVIKGKKDRGGEKDKKEL